MFYNCIGVLWLCIGPRASARGKDVLGIAGEEHGEGVDNSSWNRPEFLTSPDLMHIKLEQLPNVYRVGDFCLYFGPEKGLCAKNLM